MAAILYRGARPGADVPPLLDLGVLADLEAELPGASQRFAADFAELWERRSTRLAGAVAEGRLEDALDAALSLKVSSEMVGARRLAYFAARLEAVLRSGQGNAAGLCEQIAECGPQTVALLRRGSDGPDPR